MYRAKREDGCRAWKKVGIPLRQKACAMPPPPAAQRAGACAGRREEDATEAGAAEGACEDGNGRARAGSGAQWWPGVVAHAMSASGRLGRGVSQSPRPQREGCQREEVR